MQEKKLTVVLPCYNEGELARNNALKVHSALQQLGIPFELIVCNDASTDNTSEWLKQLKDTGIRIRDFSNGPSRRENLAVALAEGNGDVLVYMDIDLSTDLEHLSDLVQPALQNRYDLVIGSRYQKGASVRREFIRFFYSYFYNLTIRLLLGSRVLDHQCGFKAIRKDVFLELKNEMGYDQQLMRGWFWDAELLIRAQRIGLRILEMPVKWTRAEKSSFSFWRELKVIPYMLHLRRKL